MGPRRDPLLQRSWPAFVDAGIVLEVLEEQRRVGPSGGGGRGLNGLAASSTSRLISNRSGLTVTPEGQTVVMSRSGGDPVPPRLVLTLDEAFRVLEALEDARLALRDSGLAPGLQDELATVIRLIHGKLGFEEGGRL